MNDLALYQLAGQYEQAFLKLADSDLDDQTIDDTLEGLEGELQEKCTSVAAFVRNLESSADAIKEAEIQMAARRKAIEKRAERIRAYLKDNMERCGISKIDSPWFKLAIQSNPPSVVIDDASTLPADYMRQPEVPPPAPDKKLIAQAIKDGFNVPGAHLEQSTRLVIK